MKDVMKKAINYYRIIGLVIMCSFWIFLPHYFSFAAEPPKIVAMDPILSQWLLAVKCGEGAKDILITEVGKNEYMQDIFPGLKNSIMRKKIDNAESLMLLNPKMIFIKTRTDHNYSELKKSGVEVICFDFETIEDIFNGVSIMGRKLKMEKRAESLVQSFKNAMEETRKNVEKKSKLTSKPRVYFANSNIYNSTGRGMYQNFLIETAGGASVTSNSSGSKIQISVEELIKYDPQIIITAAYCSDTPDMIMKNDKLKDLSAVKNKKIFVMPRYVTSWDMPAPESILGVMWLAEKFDSNLKLDLNKRMKDFYLLFYDIKMNGGEAEKILNR